MQFQAKFSKKKNFAKNNLSPAWNLTENVQIPVKLSQKNFLLSIF